MLCSTSLLSSLWAPRLTLYAKLFAFPNASSTSQPGHYPSISRMNLLSLPYLASLPGNNNISILSVPHGWRPLCHSFPVVLGDSSQVLSVVSCWPLTPEPSLPSPRGRCLYLFAWTPAVPSYLPSLLPVFLTFRFSLHTITGFIVLIMFIKIINEHRFNYVIFLLKSLRVFSLLRN